MNIKNVFNNTYGLGRSLLATGTLVSLCFTPPYYYFTHFSFKIEASTNNIFPNLFFILGEEHLYASVGIAIGILIFVISGYLPQVTGILHAWVSYSFFTGSFIIEGGDQITQILTFLLIPITIFDKRLNHWGNREFLSYRRYDAINYFCYSIIVIIQLQMSIVYFFAASEKLHVKEWVNGSAFYYWFNNHPFGANDFLHNLLDPIVQSHFLSPIINWGAILLEVLLFAALFMDRKKKLYMLILGVLFHLSIIIIHGLASFFFAMAGGLVIYLLPVGEGIPFKNLGKVLSSIRKYISEPKLLYGKALILFSISYAFMSCNKPEPYLPKIDGTLDSTYSYLKDIYLWQDKIPSYESITPASFSSPIELTNQIRNFSPFNEKLKMPSDRWSFAIKTEDWNNLISGTYRDFGIGFKFAGPTDLRICWVQPKSIAGQAGLKRGDKILSINGVVPEFSDITNLAELLANQESLSFRVSNNFSEEYNLVLTKSNYEFTPIIKEDIFVSSHAKVGYLNLISFTGDPTIGFKNAFVRFKKEQISELIIDLRYNGGGLLSIMEDLASYLVPEQNNNKVFYRIQYNKKYDAFNEKVFFKINPDRINLTKVTFIVGPNTASASEMLIYSMAEHINVTTVGLETQGKLLGMQPTQIGSYVIVPISFMVLNGAESNRDVNFNIVPTQPCLDDLYHDFNMDEGNILTAIGDGALRKKAYDQIPIFNDRNNLISSTYLPISIARNFGISGGPYNRP